MKHFRLFPLLIIIVCTGVKAQDMMYLRGQKQPIKVKVIEIGLDEIKYKYWPVSEEAPVQVIEKDNVSKVTMQNGDGYEFTVNPLNQGVNYAEQRNSAIKVNFLSPLYTHLAISYEKSLKPGRSYEATLGIIGIGVGDEVSSVPTRPAGLFGRFGFKFITSPDFYVRGMRYAHILKGGYIKPEVVLGNYGIDRPVGYNYYSNLQRSVERRSVIFGAFIVNFGKQWVFDDKLLFDMYLGFGYVTSNFSSVRSSISYDSYGPESYHYAFLGGWDIFPIALTSGVKIGYLFNKPKPAPTQGK